MAYKRITIQLKGDPSDDEHLRLSDFIAQLDAIRGALSRLEEQLASGERATYYRVVDLRHSSPATVVLEAVPFSMARDITPLVIGRFVDGLRRIRGGEIPSDFSYDVLESFKKLAAPLQKRVTQVSIASDGESVEITKSIEADIDRLVGPDEIQRGSISGTLELINIHASANHFRIYPVVGPKKLDCHFPSAMLQLAIQGINKYVRVDGELRYKRREKFPYKADVHSIEIFPDDEALPNIFDIRGIAPNATGEVSSEEFVSGLRRADW